MFNVKPQGPLTPSILNEWNTYRREVLPFAAPKFQVHACRHAFYAGAVVAMKLIGAICRYDGRPEEEVRAALLVLGDEVTRFYGPGAKIEAGPSDGFAPPIGTEQPHYFEPVEGNGFCGKCGGGKLHAIHAPMRGETDAG